MERPVLKLEERLRRIVDQSYDILCQQITEGRFIINNEASLQLQFSVILKTIGQLYEFDSNDRFSIELEKRIKLEEETCKSSDKARCDIWLKLTNSCNKCAECAIELKCFKKNAGETITSNRFSILKDLENLEHYQSQNKELLCYGVVYTNNHNYTKETSSSYLPIGEGCKCSGIIENKSKSKRVELRNEYIFDWDVLSNKKEKHNFLKIEVKNNTSHNQQDEE